MRIAGLLKNDFTNGQGICVSLFVKTWTGLYKYYTPLKSNIEYNKKNFLQLHP